MVFPFSAESTDVIQFDIFLNIEQPVMEKVKRLLSKTSGIAMRILAFLFIFSPPLLISGA
jgi:hypothetical protein